MADYLASIKLYRVSQRLVQAAKQKPGNILLTEDDEVIRELGSLIHETEKEIEAWENKEKDRLLEDLASFKVGKWLKYKTINELDRMCLYFGIELSIEFEK